jgi:ABC transporter substrate binding protein (PQQ-dependent alcohol dehydrogenase system)
VAPTRRGWIATLLGAALLGASGAAPGSAQDGGKVTFGYLGLADDPRHRAQETYANLLIRPEVVPLDGARLGMRDARVIGRALKVEFALEAVQGADLAAIEAGLARLVAEHGTRFALVDLPAPELRELVARTRDAGVWLLNVSAIEDELRGEACAPHLLHTAPSRAMLADALAQYLAFLQWRDALLLVGPTAEDEAWGEALARSIRRFGGRIVETRRFVAGRDPRQRELNNVRLLTQGVSYDVVAVADVEGEFGRQLSYQTVLPRPVVGSHGLVPRGWHWAFERHGAPQLNQRFERQISGGRRMADAEHAAWAAVKLLLEAHTRARSADPARVRAALRDQELTLDVYKGNPASFRTWDNQLRQPILLATLDAVIARAPVERFLHQRNVLDTLGVDQPESRCRL